MDTIITAAIVGGLMGSLCSYIASKTLLIPYLANRKRTKVLKEIKKQKHEERLKKLNIYMNDAFETYNVFDNFNETRKKR